MRKGFTQEPAPEQSTEAWRASAREALETPWPWPSTEGTQAPTRGEGDNGVSGRQFNESGQRLRERNKGPQIKLVSISLSRGLAILGWAACLAEGAQSHVAPPPLHSRGRVAASSAPGFRGE